MKFNIEIHRALNVVKANLAAHTTELDEAKKGWVEDVKKELDNLRDAVDRKGLDASNYALQKLFHAVPKDNRKDYSRYIGALERAAESNQTHVELDEDDYDKMFNDNWEWRAVSKDINSTYLKQRR